MEDDRTYSAFVGQQLLISGELTAMLRRTKEYMDAGGTETPLIFEDQTGRQVDFDFRGTAEEVVERAAPSRNRTGPGRPRLGVVSREISLLPRHWEWLELQPQGISAALRRLVDEARRREPGREQARIVKEAAGKFMWAMAGNLPGFEEASRALFTDDQTRFAQLICDWPRDIRRHLERLVERANHIAANPSSLHESEGATQS